MNALLSYANTPGEWFPVLALFAAKAAVILGAAAVVTQLMRRQSASRRHLVWTIGTVAVLALPVLGLAAPAWAPGIPGLHRLIAGSGPDGRAQVPEAEDAAGWAAVLAPPSAPARAVEQVAPAPLAIEPAPAAVVRPSRAGGGSFGTGEGAAPAKPAIVPEASISWESPAPAAERAAPRVSAWLVVAWAVGALLVLATLVDGLLRTARLGRRAYPVTDRRRRELFGEVATRARIERDVRLVEIDAPCMPMTWGVLYQTVLLPAESIDWPDARIVSVLSHELAHVSRADYLTQLLARVVCAVHWFNPLAWFAAARLREERERACDDLVLASGARASDYANHLLDVAKAFRSSPVPAAASVCMARPSRLRARLLAVLDATQARAGVTRRWASTVGVGALALAFPLAGVGAGTERAADLPTTESADAAAVPDALSAAAVGTSAPRSSGPSTPITPDAMPRLDDRGVGKVLSDLFGGAGARCDWDTRAENMSSSHIVDDDLHTVRIRFGDCRLELEFRGTVTFTPDDRDVASVSAGGYFEIEAREDGVTRRLEITPARGGGLDRKWLVDRREQPYDAAASEWLSRMLLVAFRRAGMDAQARAERILATSGVEGIQREIAFLRSDYTAGRYYGVLLAQPNLDVATVRSVVRDAGQRIDSDYELGRLLRTVAEHQPLDEAVLAAYVEAAGSLDSDYEHRRVLSAILGREHISRELANEMLRQASNIESDYERSQLLRQLLEAHPLDEVLTPAFFEAVRDIDSDYEKRRVFTAVFQHGAPSRAVLDRTLTMVKDIESDHELAQLLLQVAELYPMGAALPTSYLDAAGLLDSDYERGRVLRTLLARDSLSVEGRTAVLDAVAGISSDYEANRILKQLAAGGPIPPGIRPAYFRAVAGLSSDYERASVLVLVLEHQILDDDMVGRVIESATEIDSDYSLGQVLIKAAQTYDINDALRPAFMRAVDRIESQHTRGQVLTALYPRGRPAE